MQPVLFTSGMNSYSYYAPITKNAQSTKDGKYVGSGALGIVVDTKSVHNMLLFLQQHYWSDPLGWLLM